MNNNHKFKLQYRPSAIETYLNYQQPNAEVEGKESVLTPNGILSKFEGPSHAQGGIDVNLPPKSLIFSTKLKLPASIVEELIGVKKAMSPADLSKKFPTKNYMEVLADPNSSKLKKDTSDYMLKKNLASLYSIFQAQQDYKDSKGIKDGVLLDDQNPKAKYGMYTQYQSADITPSWMTDWNKEKAKGTARNPQWSTALTPENGWYPRTFMGEPNTYYKDPLTAEQVKYVEEPHFNDPEIGKIQSVLMPTPKYNDDLESISTRKETTKNYFSNLIGADNSFRSGKGQPSQHMVPYGLTKDNQWVKLDKNANLEDYQDYYIENFVDEDNPGNRGLDATNKKDISNQRNVTLIREGREKLEPLNPLEPLPLKSLGPVKSIEEEKDIQLPKLPETKITAEATTPKTKYHYRDIEDAIGIGGALSRLMENNIKLPYYNNTNLTYIPTRYEQVNTLQPERSLDAAKQAIMSSNLPESVKQARLAEMSSNALEAANKIQIQNTQGDVQNDNRNIAAYVDTYNKNQALRNQANAQYTKESQIAQGQYEDIRNQNFDVIGNILKNRNRDKFKLAMYNAMNPMYEFDINGNLIKFNPKARTEDESVWFDKSKNQIMSLADSYIERYKMDPKEAVTAATNFYKSRKSEENNSN